MAARIISSFLFIYCVAWWMLNLSGRLTRPKDCLFFAITEFQMKINASTGVLVTLYITCTFKRLIVLSTRKKHTIFIKNVVYQYKKIGPFNYSLITERGREGDRWWTGMDPQDGGGSARQSRGACLLDVHLKNVLVSEFLYTNLFFTSRSERLAPFSFRLLLILTYHTRSLFCAFCGGA